MIATIKRFTRIIGFTPNLVFDRGFAAPDIVRFLAHNQYMFCIRIKKNKAVIDIPTNQRYLAKHMPDTDTEILAHGIRLRLVISDTLLDMIEPWYLITNDFRASRALIVTVYYHRFEIEEFFRDAKRLLGLEYVRCKTALSPAVTLWFTILGIWFLWTVEQKLTENDDKAWETWRLSIVRYCWEYLRREIILAAEGQFMPQKGG